MTDRDPVECRCQSLTGHGIDCFMFDSWVEESADESAEVPEPQGEPDALCGDWPAPCGCDDPDTHDGSVPRWLVEEESSEVSDPSEAHMDALERIDQAVAYIRAAWLGNGEPTRNTPAGEIIAILRGVRTFEPEPSAEGPAFIAIMPPSPETSKRWYSMYCRECGIEEMMAETADDPRLIARRNEHNRERHQGEPSDAQVRDVLYFALRDAGEGRTTAEDLSRKLTSALRAAREVR